MTLLTLLGALLGFTTLCAYDQLKENIDLKKKIDELTKKDDLKGDDNVES